MSAFQLVADSQATGAKDAAVVVDAEPLVRDIDLAARILVFQPLVIHAGGDVAFAHSLNRLAGTRLGGGRTDMWMRSTLGFKKTADGWRIVHGHTSVPFDPADGFKACLGLRP